MKIYVYSPWNLSCAIIRIFIAVPAVGFRLMEDEVGEAVPTVYSCVEIVSSSGPLASNVVVEFHTQDGSAKGDLTKFWFTVLMILGIAIVHQETLTLSFTCYIIVTMCPSKLFFTICNREKREFFTLSLS